MESNSDSTTSNGTDSGSGNDSSHVMDDTSMTVSSVMNYLVFEKPLAGVILITVLYAVILQFTMMKKKPRIDTNSFDSLIDDWDESHRGVKKSKKGNNNATTRDAVIIEQTKETATKEEDGEEKSPTVVTAEAIDDSEDTTAATKTSDKEKTASSKTKKKKKNSSNDNTKEEKKEDSAVTAIVTDDDEDDDDAAYKVGDRVILKGFKSASKYLNRRHGVIAGKKDKNNNNRYPVDLDLFSTFASSATLGSKQYKSSVFVNENYLSAEKPISDTMNKERAPMNYKNGCLEETHAMVCSFIFSNVRNIINSALRNNPEFSGEDNPNNNALQKMYWGWNFWNTAGGKQGIYPSLCRFLKVDLLRNPNTNIEKLENQLNPKQPSPNGSFKFLQDSVDDVRAVKGWDVRIHGDFWIVHLCHQEPQRRQGETPQQQQQPDLAGTFVIPCDNTRQVFLVVGYQFPLGVQFLNMVRHQRAVKLRLTLLPWFGRIIHDPFVAFTTGTTNRIEIASAEQTKELRDSVQLAMKQNRVISRFSQLETPAGCKQGLPMIYPVPKPTLEGVPKENILTLPPPGQQQANGGGPQQQPMMAPPKMSPPTTMEETLLKEILEFENYPPPPKIPKQSSEIQDDQDKMGFWNFIRKGSIDPNADLNNGTTDIIMIMNSVGQNISEFPYDSSASSSTPESDDVIPAPTTTDILSAMLLTIKQHNNKRPVVIGVDAHGKCIQRLQFLFATLGTQIKPMSPTSPPTKVLGLNVQRKEQPHQHAPQQQLTGVGAMAIPEALLPKSK